MAASRWLAIGTIVLTSAVAAEIGVVVPLVDAAKNGDHAGAIKLIDQKVNVNTPEADGTTALHWAAHNNDADLVDKLIQAGANSKVKNDFGATPMSEAAANSNTAIIEKLLKAGADPDSPGADGVTALMVVARSTNVAAARLLLEHGAHVNAKETQRDQTALMWASAERQGQMVKELIAHGADVNAHTQTNEYAIQVSAEPRAGYRPAGGLTALLYATREGCLECVQALKEGGANLNQADPEGVTPLITAIWNQHYDTAAYLIKAGANVNKWDWWGRGPLWCAVDLNTIPHGGRNDGPSLDETSSLQIIDMLLKAGANPNLQLKLRPPYRNVPFDRGGDQVLSTGATPLLRASKAGDNPAAMRLLLEHHALVDLPNSDGVTPLMIAAGMGHGINPSRGRYQGDDDAALAVGILLDAGADIHRRAGNGMNAVHSAAMKGWTATIRLLAERGAEVDIKDRDGKTPLDYATGNYKPTPQGGGLVVPATVNPETVKLLQQLTKVH
jgi:ankyrin repeat protein